MIQIENFVIRLWIWGTEIVFICLQVSIYYKWLLLKKIDIYCREPNIFYCPLIISLHDSRKTKTFRDRRYMKEKLKGQQYNLALFIRKNGVALEEENDNDLKCQLTFLFFLGFPSVCKLVFFSFQTTLTEPELSF